MTKSEKTTILKRLGTLVPDVDAICQAYKVDEKRAKKIHKGMYFILGLFGDLLLEQAEFMEGQAGTAELIERQAHKEKDAKTILDNIEVFTSGDPATVKHILNTVFADVFADEFGKLLPERQVELFASLRVAVNSLKRRDNILLEPEK